MSPTRPTGALRLARPLAVIGVGVVAAIGLGLARGSSLDDAVVMAGLAAGGATVAAFVGWWALAPLRRQSVRRQAVSVALLVAVAMAAGVLLAARAMFISSHDLNALIVVLLAAGSAGAAAGLRLGARIDDDSRSVGALARSLGGDRSIGVHGVAELVAAPPTQELARLADEIAEVSAALDEARSRERALEQSRRELIAWISHDLRGPLTSIRAMAEAMEDGVVTDGPTVDRYHASTRLETERLTALVDDLFELSRITAGVTTPVVQRVQLTEVLDEAVDTVAATAESAGVRFEREYRSLPVLEVSLPELRRVLHNLLDNAIRHTRVGGHIVVEGHAEAGGAVVTVTDECGGIPAGDIDRVFDLAFRGDRARGRDGGGGLGLTIAKGLVEAHRGTLEVDNRDAGCRFTVKLPAAAGQ